MNGLEIFDACIFVISSCFPVDESTVSNLPLFKETNNLYLPCIKPVGFRSFLFLKPLNISVILNIFPV